MKHLPLIISSILIIIAFFMGILFEKTKYNGELSELQNQKHYINIEQLKTKLKIHNDNPNIIIQVN
ncbi:hypothetical protein LR004_01480, partial [Candidatus Gracilibacteria bacterium]|nr:hypothetical protein [Candidatus Gracilibacteria bacterium]